MPPSFCVLWAMPTTPKTYFAFGIGGECRDCGNCGVDVAAEGAHSELESADIVAVILIYLTLAHIQKRATY